MKNEQKKLLIMVMAGAIGAPHFLFSFYGKSAFLTRSQSVHAERELVGWQRQINLHDGGDFYGSLSVTPEYSRSFNPCEISQFLFGSNGLTFSGSRIDNRGERDILADYFGLPTDFKSHICFDPRIVNFLIDFDFYFGLDNLHDGLYFRIHAPVVHAKWDLQMLEEVVFTGTAVPAGYLSPMRLSRTDLSADVQTALRGQTIFGDMKNPLLYGKIWEREFMTRLSDIQLALGWNATGERYHAGFNVRMSIPTGNRPRSEFFFEPIVGNGKHWELGGGLSCHDVLWQSDDHDQDIAVYCDANLTHLFPAEQKRSFDFKANGPGSRYMLLEDIGAPSQNLFLGGAGVNPAPNQYQGRLVPAINLTTLETTISIAVQADIALKFAYHRKGFGVDVGYDFWMRSKEKMQCRAMFESGRYALKGDSQVYGFDSNAPTALNPSQHRATLHAGQGVGNVDFKNNNIDSPTNAANSANFLKQLNAQDSADFNIPQANVQTSNPAILLTDDDIDCTSVLLPNAYSQTIFFHMSNVWQDSDWQPFFGGGGSVEWAHANCARNSGCSLWSVWFKGGISY